MIKMGRIMTVYLDSPSGIYRKFISYKKNSYKSHYSIKFLIGEKELFIRIFDSRENMLTFAKKYYNFEPDFIKGVPGFYIEHDKINNLNLKDSSFGAIFLSNPHTFDTICHESSHAALSYFKLFINPKRTITKKREELFCNLNAMLSSTIINNLRWLKEKIQY